MTVETDINKRWEQGIEHHLKSIAFYKSLADLDYKYGGDSFGFKSGGDGDNGEHLMYLMDIHFETIDEGMLSKNYTTKELEPFQTPK